MTSSFVRLQSYLWNFDRGNGLLGLPQEVTALADYAEVYTPGEVAVMDIGVGGVLRRCGRGHDV